MTKLTVQMVLLLDTKNRLVACLYRQVSTKAASHKNSDLSHWGCRKTDSRLEEFELMNEHKTPSKPQPPTHHRLNGS